LVLKSTYLQVK